MPELPEAETIVRTLAPHIQGRPLAAVELLTARVGNGRLPKLDGLAVIEVWRYGKQIIWELEAGLLIFQLRMTGSLRWREEAERYTRARFRFPNGAVCFDDIRQFGSVRFGAELPAELGPDPLDISADELARRLHGRRRQLKPLLLDQHFLRGLGNIYVDEILHRARIHPTIAASDIGRVGAGRLWEATQEVLTQAIRHGGSSISDYVDANGEAGRFQRFHRVYGKAGRSCPRCGTAIRRIVVGQRGTHYCPRCQRR